MSFDKNKILSKAQKFIQQGKLPKAIEEFQKIVDIDPSDVRTHLKIGDLYAKLGNIEDATETYKKVGEHYAKDGFFLKAIAVFKQILKLDPGVIKVYLRLAELYNQLGLNSEAMKQYQVVVKHYENKGMKKESLDVLQKMADLDPENVASKVKLAELYTKEGFQNQAVEQFKNVARELKEKNNFEDLIKVLEKMASMNPEDAESLKELSSVYLKVGEPKKALAKLQICFKVDPKEPGTLELLAQAFVDLQQPEKARSVYKELFAVYEEKGMIEEKENVHARMKELVPEETFHPSQASFAEPKTSDEFSSDNERELLEVGEEPVAPKEEPKPSDSASKVVSEIDVYLKYGLLDKALENIMIGLENYPENVQLKEKLSGLLEAQSSNPALEKSLKENIERLKKQGKQNLVKILTEAGSGASAGPADGSQDAAGEIEEVEEEVLLIEEEIEEGSKGHEISLEGEDVQIAAEKPETVEPSQGPKIEFPEDISIKAQDQAGDISDDLEREMVRSEAAQEKMDLSSLDLKEEPQAQSAISLDIEPKEESGSISLGGQSIDEQIKSQAQDAPKPAKEISHIKEISKKKASKEAGPAEKYKDEMEEADFFIRQGLLEEAKYIYESIIEAEPDFPYAKERLSEIGSLINKDAKSKIKSKISSIDLKPAPESSGPAPVDDSIGGDLFDLGRELESEIRAINQAQAEPQEESVMTFEEMFRQFKKGVNASLSPDDYQAHYDLGVAYKEMGLLEDAVSEFKTAMVDARLKVNSISMIGLCYTTKGECDNAVKIFEEGLKLVNRDSEEGYSMLFDMAEAVFKKGDFETALSILREIRNKKASFRNVTKRINEIEALMAERAKIEESSAKAKAELPEVNAQDDKKDDDDDEDGDEGDKQDKISYL